ncbi:hypothetical protein HBB16_00740 [Pseudonocardia sp. MCCB 268]|nr:hypothetical protein [Pseudonocardia cytotoxica]
MPPPIGRYCFLDLRPGRQPGQYTLAQGDADVPAQRRSPTPEPGDWDPGQLRRPGVVRDRHRPPRIPAATAVNLVGFCAGRIIATHRAPTTWPATGDRRVHGMSYAVTLLDFGERAIAAFQNAGLLRLVGERSRRTGIITNRQTGRGVHLDAPRRPGVQLRGQQLPHGRQAARVRRAGLERRRHQPARALHCQFLDIFRDNLLVAPRRITVLGSPVHLKDITVPTFVTGAVADHLTRGRLLPHDQLLGGEHVRAQLLGHIASPGQPAREPQRAHYWTGGPARTGRTPGTTAPPATRAAGGRPGRRGSGSHAGRREATRPS